MSLLIECLLHCWSRNLSATHFIIWSRPLQSGPVRLRTPRFIWSFCLSSILFLSIEYILCHIKFAVLLQIQSHLSSRRRGNLQKYLLLWSSSYKWLSPYHLMHPSAAVHIYRTYSFPRLIYFAILPISTEYRSLTFTQISITSEQFK